MRRAIWGSVLALGAIGAGGWFLWRKKHQVAVNPPPFVAWVEISNEPKTKGALEAYPLFSFKGGRFTDMSFDPAASEIPLESVTADRFPFTAKPTMQAYLHGRNLGSLVVRSYQPEEVSCNELVVGKVDWTEKKHHGGVPAGASGFLAAFQAPNQRSWACGLSAERKHELEAKFKELAIARFGLPGDAVPKEFDKSWFSFGPGKGDLAFMEILFSVGEEDLKVLNSVVQVDGDKGLKVVWEVEGQGAVESDEGIPVYEYLDAFDIDGDGIPELVLKYHNYESNAFVVLQIGPGKPVELWNGSGYGC